MSSFSRAASIIFLTFLLLLTPLAAQARTIALVYDDSGSMASGGRWLYANYALQILTGLLSSDDALWVVRMSRPDKGVQVNPADAQAEILKMRAQRQPVQGVSTPYQTVRTAMAAIEKSGDSDSWLIMVSDGGFNDAPDESTLHAEIPRFIEKTGAKTLFLIIGEKEADVAQVIAQPAVRIWEKLAQTAVLKAIGKDDVVEQLRRIASAMTSRTREGEGLSVVRTGDRSLTLRTPFPLKRLTVLDQGPDPGALSTVTSAKAASDRLAAPRPLQIEMPRGGLPTARLYGRMSHMVHEKPGSVIPEGEVTVELDKNVDVNRMRFLPEVAARFDVSLQNGRGEPLKPEGGLYRLCEGETVRMAARLTTLDGKNLLSLLRNDPEKLKQVSASFRYGEKPGFEPLNLESAGDVFSAQMVALAGKRTISAAAELPGYFYFKSNVFTLNGASCVRLDAGAEKSDGTVPPLESGAYASCAGEPVKIVARLLDREGRDVLSEKEAAAFGLVELGATYGKSSRPIPLTLNRQARRFETTFPMKEGESSVALDGRTTGEARVEGLRLRLLGIRCGVMDLGLTKASGEEIKPVDGVYKVCTGEPVRVLAKATAPDGASLFDRELNDPGALSRLTAEARFSGEAKGVAMKLDSSGSFLETTAPALDGVHKLTASARAAGALDLSSNSITVQGVPCFTMHSRVSDPEGREMAPVSGRYEVCSGDSVRVQTTLLTREGKNLLTTQGEKPVEKERFRLSLRNPAGGEPVAMEHQPARGDFTGEHVVLNGTYGLLVSADAPGYRPVDPEEIRLEGTDCEIRLLPTAPWSARVTELDKAPPLELVPVVQGRKIPPEQFAAWTMTERHDARAGIDAERGGQAWKLHPRPFWNLAALTQTGAIPVDVEIRSPKRVLRTRVELQIQDVGWWTKWGGLLTGFLIFVLLATYLYGIVKKPRFSGGSRIEHRRKSVMREAVKPPERSNTLPGPWYKRYLVPFTSETTPVKELRFKAGRRSEHILLPKDLQTEKMRLNGLKLEVIMGRIGVKDLSIKDGDVLEVEKSQHSDCYRYVKA